ncbi:MAG: hypothetical protein JWN64_590 [Parcubacteria group bacterium]|nr:hypothetical protein [Parcubacteria group bacterium]
MNERMLGLPNGRNLSSEQRVRRSLIDQLLRWGMLGAVGVCLVLMVHAEYRYHHQPLQHLAISHDGNLIDVPAGPYQTGIYRAFQIAKDAKRPVCFGGDIRYFCNKDYALFQHLWAYHDAISVNVPVRAGEEFTRDRHGVWHDGPPSRLPK